MFHVEYSSNNGATKYVTKETSWHGNNLFWIQLRRIDHDVSSQADPVRENWTWSYPHFSWNCCFQLVKNTITHALSILTRFDIVHNFLKNT